MTMTNQDADRSTLDELTRYRRDLHRIPELDDDLPALLCLFIRDLRHGAQLTVADESGTRPAATPEGALFAFLAQGALRERFGRETEPANSPERALLSLTSTDPSKAGDGALELALRFADPQLLTCLDRIVPDHESYFRTTPGYNGNAFVAFRDRDSAAALASRLRHEPAIAEYLLHARIELAATAPDRKPVDVVTPDGSIESVDAADLDLGYRRSRVASDGLVVLAATFDLDRGDPEKIRATMDDLMRQREEKQPLDLPSAGSTFKRPEGHFAGKLIMDAGLQGCRVGGAEVSTKHAGFVVNVGGATAADVHAVIEHVQDEVERQFGVRLEPEVRFLG